MCALSKQTFMPLEYKIQNYGKNKNISSFVRLLFFLSIYAAILSVSSIEFENSNRGRVIAPNDRIDSDNNDLSVVSSRPNWWQKKIDRRPTLAVNDEPIGTGVPTWKEVDIYGVDSRRGRSFSNAFKDEQKSSAHYFASSSLISTILSLLLFLSLNIF